MTFDSGSDTTSLLDGPELAEETANEAERPIAVGKDLAPQRRRRLALFLAMSTVVLIGIGVPVWWHLHGWESTDDAQVDGHVYPISARVGGRVEKVFVEDGQPVRVGDPLVQIEKSDYQLALDRAEADYRDAAANVQAAQLGVPISRVGSETQIAGASADMQSAEAGVTLAQASEKAAQAQLVQAAANARKLNADVARNRELLQARVIAQQQFDDTLAAADAANASVSAQQAALAVAGEQVRQAEARRSQSKSQIANARETTKNVLISQARSTSAQAQLLRARSGLEQARLNLQYTTVVAPAEGVVGKRSVQVGQNIQPSEDLLAIVPTREIWITANFKETQLAKMRAGQPVTMKLDTYGGREWRGHVTSIGGATGAKYSLLPPENATGNYVKVVQRVPVRIDFEDLKRSDFNRDGALRPGMSVVPRVKVR